MSEFKDWADIPAVTSTGGGWVVRINGSDVFDSINQYGVKTLRSFDIVSGLSSREEAESFRIEWLKKQLPKVDQDVALAREDALREELELVRKAVPNSTLELASLQQRLTVSERRLSQVEGACDLVMSAIDDDERGANFVKIIQAIKDKAALKPAAGPHKCIECESQYCHGVCVERGDDDECYKGAEGEGS